MKPNYKILWNKKDVTSDISRYLSSLSYADREEGMSDDITLTLDNSTMIWFNDWYPEEGDTLDIYIGNDKLTPCGLFQVDEITLSGKPDVIEIKAIAAGITKKLRTRNNKAFENQTLRQIAKFFCDKHGLTLVDKTSMLSKINLDRKTQENKTDLAFLAELAKEYGFIFSVRGEKLIFTSYYDLDNADSIKEFGLNNLSSYSITQKTYDTYAATEFKARNKKKNKVITSISEEKDDDKIILDVNTIGGKVTNEVQAEAKANAGLWGKNKFKQTASIVIPGDSELMSGVNIDLIGLGKGSGKYHIVASRHTLGSSGYTCSVELRRTGAVPKVKAVPRETKQSPQIKDEEIEGYEA